MAMLHGLLQQTRRARAHTASNPTHAQKIGNATDGDAVIAVRAAGVRAAHEQCATRSEVLFLHLEDAVCAVDVERTVPGPVPESGYEYS